MITGSIMNLISSKSILIVEIEDSHSVQYAVKNMSSTAGFNITDQTLIATVASELATNILRYAETGEIIIKILDNSNLIGLELEAIDKGPGIENIDDALKDSFTTSKNILGLGLPSSKRIMDEFLITSEVGKGTKIIARKWRIKDEA